MGQHRLEQRLARGLEGAYVNLISIHPQDWWFCVAARWGIGAGIKRLRGNWTTLTL